MKEYMASIIWVSIIAGIAEISAPSLGSMKKYVKLIGALCVVCVLVMPLVNFTGKSDKIFNTIKDELKSDINNEEINKKYQEILYSYLNDYSENEFKEQINSILKDKFNIPYEEANITLFSVKKENGIYPDKIRIILSGKSIFKNPYNIEDYFENLIGCKCEVLIE